MVSRIAIGQSIRGALNYNEKKVKEGKAFPLESSGYLKSIYRLSFSEKLQTLERQAALNERVKANCLHISLNFDPSEKLLPGDMKDITDFYMDRLGFGEQPYLVYRHVDVAHPHVHIVTTSIREDGTAIPLHNIGQEKSEVARKATEKQFGLVRAEGHKKENLPMTPVAAQKVIYGKGETKAAISNVVGSVLRDYRFTTLAGLNAVLRGFNVQAYRGEPGTRMHEKGGLAYSVLDEDGNRVGTPVRSSDLYARPTLKKLETLFQQKKDHTGYYNRRIREAVDRAIEGNLPDLDALEARLKRENIETVLYRNRDKTMVYGIAFVDRETKTVVNGSELGRDYSAGRIQERLGIAGRLERKREATQRAYLSSFLKDLPLHGDAGTVLGTIYGHGLKLATAPGRYRDTVYSLSFQDGKGNASIGIRSAAQDYLENSQVTPALCDHLNEYVRQNGVQQVQQYLQGLFAQQSETVFGHITPDRKKPKRRINW